MPFDLEEYGSNPYSQFHVIKNGLSPETWDLVKQYMEERVISSQMDGPSVRVRDTPLLFAPDPFWDTIHEMKYSRKLGDRMEWTSLRFGKRVNGVDYEYCFWVPVFALCMEPV
jgi:hypothetical protein